MVAWGRLSFPILAWIVFSAGVLPALADEGNVLGMVAKFEREIQSRLVPPPAPTLPAGGGSTCPACVCAGEGAAISADLDNALLHKDASSLDMPTLLPDFRALQKLIKQLLQLKSDLEGQLQHTTIEHTVTPQAVNAASKLLDACNPPMAPATVLGPQNKLKTWKGYECSASEFEVRKFLNYSAWGACPNDWFFAQRLLFDGKCYALPRRRCLSLTPVHPQEPEAVPSSRFLQQALKDRNVLWDFHECKSFRCLLSRPKGECKRCWNMTMEEQRWTDVPKGFLTIRGVVKLKKGHLRVGLDVGGGTGTFAALMARHNVTVVTTGLNKERAPLKKGGLPYMETIAARGLIPLHLPHESRLPFYDGTLDLIHTMDSIIRFSPARFEELLFEWDRILRPGGVIWFDGFYGQLIEIPVYVSIIELLGYRKLFWKYTSRPESSASEAAIIYLNALIEKPARP